MSHAAARHDRRRITATGVSVAAAVISMIAAVGAVAHATIDRAIPPGATVGGRDVRDGSLTGSDLRNGSVSGVDIRDHSVQPIDLSPAVVDATRTMAVASTSHVQLDADGTVVLRRVLPRGSYVFTASVLLLDIGQSVRTVHCQIDRGSPEDDRIAGEDVRLGVTDGNELGQVVVIGAATLGSTTAVTLRCFGGPLVDAVSQKLIATRVGSVTTSGIFTRP